MAKKIESLYAKETHLTGSGLLFRCARDIAILAFIIFLPLYLFNPFVITPYWITWGAFIWFKCCIHDEIQSHRAHKNSRRARSTESVRRTSPLVYVGIAYLLYVISCFVGFEFIWVRLNEHLLDMSKNSSALNDKLIVGTILLCNWMFLNIELLFVLKANRTSIPPVAIVLRMIALLVHLGAMPAIMSFHFLANAFDDSPSTTSSTRWDLVGVTGLYLLILCLMFVPKDEIASDS